MFCLLKNEFFFIYRCKVQSFASSTNGKGSNGDNSNSPTDTDSSFLLGQPPSLDYNKVRVVIDENNENNTTNVLDSLWWRMAKVQPPTMKTPGMIQEDALIVLRKNLRKKVVMEITSGRTNHFFLLFFTSYFYKKRV
jgi:hypothetical protein